MSDTRINMDILHQTITTDENNQSKFKCTLNFECTQYTIGKTSKVINCIANVLKSNDNNDKHEINIVSVNNNLEETKQWMTRTKKELKEIVNRNVSIQTISSKTSKNNCGSGKSVSDFITSLIKQKSLLPEVLIMCSNKKRVYDDLMEILDAATRIKYNLTFNLFIDEADRSINLIVKSLENIKKENLEKQINYVHFITATPGKDFWEKLKKYCGIKKLIDFDKFNLAPKISDEERKNATKLYQSVLTQTFIGVDEPTTKSPLDNIKYIMDKTNHVDESKPVTIFVPGATKKDSHNEIKEYFIQKKYWVLFHNGDFKGFINPDREKFSFEKLYNDWLPENKGNNYELRDLLVVFRKKYPNVNIAITGKNTITRGITFNSKDEQGNSFNFTHMIYSSCHYNKMDDFVQLLGRSCGHKNYCDNITIIGNTDAFNKAKKYVENILKLKNSNIEVLTKDNMLENHNKNNNRDNVVIWPDLYKEVDRYHNNPATKEEVLEHIKKIFPTAKPRLKNERNNDGKYECTIRDKKKVYTYKELYYEERTAGLSSYSGSGICKSRYRINVCYTDDDKETWCVRYRILNDTSHSNIKTNKNE